MKNNEPYNPNTKSTPPPKGILFRIAQDLDKESISSIMAEVNPSREFSELLKSSEREIELNKSDPNYRLFVAELEGRVVGLCRYYHSDGLPKEKIRFAAPEGWYCMGIGVIKALRRQNIARFLFLNRIDSLKARGATETYSLVDSNNLSSIKMHKEFGFNEVDRAKGFLHVEFDKHGILYRRAL